MKTEKPKNAVEEEPLVLDNTDHGVRFLLYNTACQISYTWPGERTAPNGDIFSKSKGESRNWQMINQELLKESWTVQKLLNMYDPKSELGKLNASWKAGIPFPLSRRLYFLLEKILDAARASNGRFDPTVGPLLRLWDFKKIPHAVPSNNQINVALEKIGYQNLQLDQKNHTITCYKDGMELDPGAWGKGYSLECCRNVLLKSGITHGVLDFGGNLCILGENPNSTDGLWPIGIQQPWSPRGKTAGSLHLSPCSVSTSAGYDNFYYSGKKIYHHLIDPENGQPATQDCISATVICPSPLYADILSTVFFIGGEAGGLSAANALHLQECTGYVLIHVDGTITISPSLAKYYQKKNTLSVHNEEEST